MRPIPFIFAAALLVGCGADTMSAAATAAAIKKQEAEEGKKTLDRVQQRIQAATDQMEKSAQKAADAGDNN
jgi:NifU-like protein involved in Fe-S cluster formation